MTMPNLLHPSQPMPAPRSIAPKEMPSLLNFPGNAVTQQLASPPPASTPNLASAPMLVPVIPTSAHTGTMPALTPADTDTKYTEAELIAQFIALRDEKKRVEAAHKERIEAQFDRRMEEIEQKVKERLDAGNMTAFKTPEGTAFKKTVTRYSVGDGLAFFDWVEQTGNTDMLKKDVRQEPVRDYLEKTQALPPGIAVYSEVVVQFRK